MPEPKRCSCCEKHTLRAEEEKKKLLNRLRRIEGQVRGRWWSPTPTATIS